MVKRNLKVVRVMARGVIPILWASCTWISRYARHPEKYPWEERYHRIRSFVQKLCRRMRFTLKTEGAEKLKDVPPSLFIGNHVSVLDPLMLILLSEKPIRFIAKKETLKMPIAGKVLKALDCLFLDRDDPRQAVRIFQKAEADIREGICSYGVYPEGTRNKDPLSAKLNPFHPGSLKIAYRAKCPVVIASMFGDFRIFGSNDLRSSELVNIKIHDPIPFEAFAEKKTPDFAAELQDIVAADVSVFVKEDQEYFASKASHHLGEKWWKDPDLPFTMEKKK